MATPQTNLELKARCPNLPGAAAAALEVGARYEAVLVQTDTYFHSAHGRLKLRQIDGQDAELIWYDRADRPEARHSRYRVVPVSDGAGMLAALEAALGVRGQVRKCRRLLLWDNIRIHLDEVENLGSFVEFEAVLGPDDDPAAAHDRLVLLCQAMNIQPKDIQAQSYIDLLGFAP